MTLTIVWLYVRLSFNHANQTTVMSHSSFDLGLAARETACILVDAGDGVVLIRC